MLSPKSARYRMTALRPKVLGLLAILWLNMAVLPCAMAFQGDDDCPHCPPADAHEMPAHHGHERVEAEPSCATAQPQCCDVVAANVDARGVQLQPKPAADLVLATLPAIASLPPRESRHYAACCDPPDPGGASPPRHVLFCVYLK
ncbi:MAG: hypothetical protein HKN64_03710 [Woeseiaceae bacterium]|nr:hypothetical protein [Woeseiaceae bacterium]